MSLDSRIANHYSGGRLLTAIEDGVRALGKTPQTVEIGDLGPVDEFHIGGRQATTELADRLELEADMELLDLGCGIGGAARFFNSTYGCRVSGIDLTPEYVAVARTLTRWTRLEDRIGFHTGSVLDMPFEDAAFDCATQLHLGMNIADKKALFAEVLRILKPGGKFAVYDILRLDGGAIAYPVPWASDPSTCFVDDLPGYRGALEEVGFVVTHERNRREFAVEFFSTQAKRAAESGEPPPLGLHVIMGAEAPRKIANMVAGVTVGTIAPMEIVARKPST